MSDIIQDAKRLLDGATPAPWVTGGKDESGNVYIGNPSEDGNLVATSGICDAELIAAAPENTQALAEEAWEYQIQTRSQRMPTWLAITDDTLQKWYSEDGYNEIIRAGRVFRGGAGFEMRVLRRRVSPPEVINE